MLSPYGPTWPGEVERPTLPNIVILYADDLGYGDVQCYNPERGKIPTPHIDRLASQGMRFTDAHSSSAVC
ncbi:MAG: sulfatase-like hydrolase/transferase, partial [Planctomycetota bacterium]|nr:sulfatase-like hydrolase/transferase [Planctomycetota bacterium]